MRRLTLIALTCILVSIPGAAQDRATPAANGDGLDGIIPGERDAVSALVGDLPRYRIEATLLLDGQGSEGATPAATPESASPTSAGTPRIEGTAEITVPNTTGAELDEVYLRLYPNLRQYEDGRIEVRDVRIDGEPARVEPPPLASVPEATPAAIDDAGSADLTLLRLPLDAPLATGEQITVTMAFTTEIPPASDLGTNIFAVTDATGTLTLAHAFPMLAGWDAEHGWETSPPAGWSDLVFAQAAMWNVSLTLQQDLVLAAPGALVETRPTGGGMETRHYRAGPIREFVMVASPGFLTQETQVGETVVTVYHQPGNEAGAATILDWAASALEIFAEAFGPYPYSTLAVVETPAMLGAEFPQVIFVGEQFFPDPVNGGSRPGAVEMLVAHEVAHQWWYGLVGINPHRDAFIDEGLAEYAAVLYFERRYSPEAAEAQMDQGVLLRYLTWLVNDRDHVAHQPTIAFPDAGAYYTMTYRKAALGFEALREAMGDEAFFAALQEIVATHRFGVLTPQEALAAFDDATDVDVAMLWSQWFERDGARVEIVMDDAATPGATPVATPHPGE